MVLESRQEMERRIDELLVNIFCAAFRGLLPDVATVAQRKEQRA